MPKKRKKPDNVLTVKFRRTWRRYRRLIILVGLVALISWAIWPLKYRSDQRRKITEYERETAEIKRENQRLKKELVWYNTDEYIELRARKDLGLAKPGEEVYQVYGGDETTGTARAQSEASADPEQASLWDKILDYLGL